MSHDGELFSVGVVVGVEICAHYARDAPTNRKEHLAFRCFVAKVFEGKFINICYVSVDWCDDGFPLSA